MPQLPSHANYVVIGAGIHGLSTAMHLARKLAARGKTVGPGGTRIVVLDKTGIGAGASGIACGVIRNNYYQPAMRELMAHCVSVWESDPETYSYHPVGYMQISPESMHAQVGTIYEQQQAIGYESVFVEGGAECMRYMQGILSDWQAKNITSVLHEKRGGYANNMASLEGLAAKARAAGVEIVEGVNVTSLHLSHGAGHVTAVATSAGVMGCDAGRRRRRAVGQLDLEDAGSSEVGDDQGPRRQAQSRHPDVALHGAAGRHARRRPRLPEDQRRPDAARHPRRHRRASALRPRRAAHHGQALGPVLQARFSFRRRAGRRDARRRRPSGRRSARRSLWNQSPEFVVDDNFADMWTSALAFCQKRFEGQHGLYRKEPSGGIGCFTPDSFPVFDRFRENAYVIADSNHGYKMIGVGDLVADELLGGKSALLDPFRFSRYAEGKLHPVSNSPFPWS